MDLVFNGFGLLWVLGVVVFGCGEIKNYKRGSQLMD